MDATFHPGFLKLDPTDSASALTYPLQFDEPDDEIVVTTRRAVSRVATVAAEAGARFQRDGAGLDPMTWMLAPQPMFDHAAPIDACMHYEPFVRAMMLHGFSYDLEKGMESVDRLLERDTASEIAVADDEREIRAIPETEAPSRLRLFTATIVSNDGFETVHAFHASLADDVEEIAGRLYCRLGAASADAVIVDGFDVGHPMVEAMVAPAVADMLNQVARDPLSPLAAGLDLNFEQRFYG